MALPRDALRIGFPLHRFELDNGLRVVLALDPSAPVVSLAVNYDVGFRSEPEGRTGFAHLFEHLTFEGTTNLPKLEHARLVEGSGGRFSASTRPDYTTYTSTLPSNALELGLFLEADRMAGPRITEENVRRQVAVVKEEIRQTVFNRPYGGFPWIPLPAVLFDTFPNAHNGYGGFTDLDSTTLDEVEDFYERYYCPGNATLVAAGDLRPDEAMGMIERHFGEIPARPAPERPSFAEPVPTVERRATHRDRFAPRPAVALGYRVPDPVAEPAGLAAAMVACAVLVQGDASRLHQRLVNRDRLADRVSGHVGAFDALDNRDPTYVQFVAYFQDAAMLDEVLAAVDDEMLGLAEGVPDEELERAVASLASGYLARLDTMGSRAGLLAVFDQQRADAGLVGEATGLLADVCAADVAAVARTYWQPHQRAVLVLEPEPARGMGTDGR